MPMIKTSCVKHTEGWVLIEPTICELDAKIREAENDTHDGKRKCEVLWPIFRICHPRSRYNFITYMIFSIEEGKVYQRSCMIFSTRVMHADRDLIAKLKKVSCLIFMSFELGTKTDEVDLA